ncbi:hypothetical protein AAC387_Pa03g3597 [Persea americana]
MSTMGKNLKRRLQSKKEEKNEEIRKAKEELDSLSNQLDSANSALTELQQELQSEKQLTQELRAQIDHLQGAIAEAGEDKKAIGAEVGRKQEAIDILQQRINQLNLEIKDKEISIKNLNLSLAGKDSECKNLTSIYNQTREDLAQANSTVEGLREEVRKLRKELELKKSSEEDLNTRLKLLVTERDEIYKKVHDLHGEYNDLKSASAKRAASDTELLSNKDHELNQFKEKMEIALSEASSNQSRNQSLIAELTRERDSLRTMLDEEANTVKKLRGELQITQETLGASKLGAADLLKQLNQSKRSCEELKSEVSRIQAESREVQKSLNQNLDEMKLSLKLRSDELVSAKEALMKTKEELLVMTDELKNVIKARENLKKELLEVNKKAELTAHDLKEEREVVVSLKKKLEEVSKQILEDKNSRGKLERDLEDAAKNLDEMNLKALTLSRELEIANSKSASLEAEKYLLSKSLSEEKNAAKEVQMNLKEIHKFFTKLCEEVEKLEGRSKRLEEELASTKEEALRLRRECNLNRSTVNEQHRQSGREAQDGTPVVMKRIGRRRRRGGPTSEASQRDNVQV